MFFNNFTRILLIAFCSYSAFSQGLSQDVRIDKPDNSTGHFISDYAGSRISQAYLFRDIDLSAYDLAVANFSFTDKDQVQKINFQPFKLFNSRSAFLNAVKTNIVQKKDITTLGVGIGWDSSDPFSGWSKGHLDDVFSNIPVPPLPIPDVTSFEDLRISLKALKLDDSIEKALIKSLVDDPKQKLVDKNNADYLSVTIPAYKEKILDSLLLEYDERRAKHVLKYTLGYNTQLFSILSAHGKANNFQDDNYYGAKANVFSATAGYSYDRGRLSFGIGYNNYLSRKDAKKESKKIRYNGYSFSISGTVFRFLKGEKLRNNENYKKSLFIPSLMPGVSWELKTTDEPNAAMIENGISRSRVVSIYLDILITPIAQFRIALPVQRDSYYEGESRSYLGANLQYTLKFSSLN